MGVQNNLNIRFIGSEQGLLTFKKLLQGKATVSNSVDATDGIIFEVPSIEVLYKIPKRNLGVPSFFYVTSPNRDLLSSIKEYSVTGILFPPLKPESILSKIDKIKNSDINMNEQDYETVRIKIIAKAENIPTLPTVAQSLISLTSGDSQAKIGDVIEQIKMDQGISSKVIKLVNSPFYGVRKDITSIDRATMLLGFSSVKNIALAISIDQYFQKPFKMFNTTGQAIWNHAYNVALICSLIAKKMQLDEEALYMAGLFHDIGKVVMVDFLIKPAETVEDERSQLGTDHAEIGSYILNKWSVSPTIVEAVKTHHDEKPSLFGSIVSVANDIENEPEKTDALIDLFFRNKPINNPQGLIDNIKKIVSESEDAR